MIYYTGFAGACETADIASKNKEDLQKVFPHQLFERAYAQNTESNVSDFENIKSLVLNGKAKGICPVGKDGTFKALWDLGELLNCGVDVNLADIPVTPETIEISEYHDLNPYRMDSTGSFVYFTEEEFAEQIQMALSENGLSSTPIGTITDNADRIVRYDNNVHYLTPRGE